MKKLALMFAIMIVLSIFVGAFAVSAEGEAAATGAETTESAESAKSEPEKQAGNYAAPLRRGKARRQCNINACHSATDYKRNRKQNQRQHNLQNLQNGGFCEYFNRSLRAYTEKTENKRCRHT